MDPLNVPAKFEVRSFTLTWDNSGYLKTLDSPSIRRSSSIVVDFGTNRKRVCDFLLVRHSNLGPILHRFGDIAGLLCSLVTPPLFHPNFGGCFRCTRSPMLASARAEASSYSAVKLFSKYSKFPTCVKIIPQRHRQTDRQTDDLLWHNRARGSSRSA